LQTGFNIFEERDKPFSDFSAITTKAVIQFPFLARLNLRRDITSHDDRVGWLSIYSGISANLSFAGDKVKLLSSPSLSFIIGAEAGYYGRQFSLFGGLQYQTDFSATEYSYGNQISSYKGSRYCIYGGIGWYAPFRRK
jgi:hypothetical protein